VKNLELAQTLLSAVYARGARELIVCAGARNAPFIKLLSANSPFKVYSFFEERSAAFFAIGRMQAEGRPVAVITTSGTAAAELLPACIEADYQRLPLILITADRPRRYRGSGAPQTIVQPGLYSHYTGAQFDIEGDLGADLEGPHDRPMHINVSFDEPLLDGEVNAWPLKSDAPAPAKARAKAVFLETKKPLVIVGGLSAEDARRIEPMLAEWKRPLYLEGPSRLRGSAGLQRFEIQGAEKTLPHLDIDGVIRIGSVPTLRYWRELESSPLPVHSFSDIPFSGLSRGTQVHALALLPENPKFEFWSEDERQKDLDLGRRREILFKEFPLSEPAWMEWLSRQIPAGARLFLGNSLPVREWDFAAGPGAARDVSANRGTNGIDGLISTFIGAAKEQGPNWAVIGDLSLMYDLSGPWALRQRPLEDFNLAVINNSGGQIFHRMFRNPLFLNGHDLHFGDWAKMWSLDYTRLETPAPLKSGKQLVEILPDAGQTESFWRAWELSQ
jgi:2-succinyl-5-enolpyruvyl-6-hydroxy-3-cyclohexene-1-carboxylate synthase